MHHGIAIAAPFSGAGKTTLTLSLLHSLKSRMSIQPFKVGPDYIDPGFHEAITGTASVNLDTFLMDFQQMRALFAHYARERVAVVEGVMGFYDGLDRQTSTYDITRSLGIPVLFVLPAAGMSHTVLALLKGLVEFRTDHTLAAVILNHLSGESHFRLLQRLIAAEFPDLRVAGWIAKGIPGMEERHLGLNTAGLNRERLTSMADRVLEHVDMQTIDDLVSRSFVVSERMEDCFHPLPAAAVKTLKGHHIAIVKDDAFSFTYTDNLRYLESLYGRVTYVSTTQNEPVPDSADLVYLPGGYVETAEVHPRLSQAVVFRETLRRHALCGKRIYAECAGLMYCGRQVVLADGQRIPMADLLPVSFQMGTRRRRLGYYIGSEAQEVGPGTTYRGHAFHYSDAQPDASAQALWNLQKVGWPGGEGSVPEPGAWKRNGVVGTYLHTMLRANNSLVERYFADCG